MSATNCVECDAPVEIKDNCVIGEIVICPDCGVELEITATDPLAIELAPEVEEDWGE